MRKLFRCLENHHWEISITQEDEAGLAGILCPVCGRAADTLHVSNVSLAGAHHSVSVSEWPDVPGYQIEAILGRGGMGVVYKARQLTLNRYVALKMLLGGSNDPERLARFRGEAEAVARLHHPHVVHIYDFAFETRPYLALEYVDGMSLAEKVKGRVQPARVAATLVEVLARAVEYAHQRGIVHRDLKPANVLLVGPPQSALEACLPKLTDFGLAKHLAAGSDQTHPGTILGTPEYMAPEQAAGAGGQATPLVDVYALGVILYELVTGQPPFRGKSALETLEQVRSLEPTPLRRINSDLPGDLETICLRCLEKAPGKRYPSAATLADDLRRFLDGRPIQARPVGAWGKTVKWAKRRPAAALLLTVCVLALGGFMAGTWWHVLALQGVNADLRTIADRERQRTTEVEQRERQLARQLYAARMNAAQQAYEFGRSYDVVSHLESLVPGSGQPDFRGLEWYYLWQRCRTPQSGLAWRTGHISTLALSPTGKTMAAGDRDGEVWLWDLTSPGLRTARHGNEGHLVRHVAFSPNGSLLASSVVGKGAAGFLELWDAATGQKRRQLKLPSSQPGLLAFSPDGSTLAVAEYQPNRAVRLRLCDLKSATPDVVFPLGPGEVRALTFSPDGQSVALAQWNERAVQIWDVPGKRLKTKLPPRPNAACEVDGVAFAHDGKTLAAITNDNHLVLWDMALEKLLATHKGRDATMFSAARFRADGNLVTGSVSFVGELLEVTTVTVHDGRSGKECVCRRLPGETIRNFALSPDGKAIAITCINHRFRVLDIDTLSERPVGTASSHKIWSVAYSPDGKMLASASADYTVRLWDASTRKQLRTLRVYTGGLDAVAFSPDGKLVAGGGKAWTVPLWNVQTGDTHADLEKSPFELVQSIAFSPDGNTLAAGTSAKTVLLWRLESGTVKEKKPIRLRAHGSWVRAVAFSPDGELLATCSDDGLIRLWGLAPWREGKPLQVVREMHDADWSRTLAFAPDGRTLATGHDSGSLKFWNVSTGKPLTCLVGHGELVRGVCFAPDGRTIASGSNDMTVRLRDVATGLVLATMREDNTQVTSVAFAPDGRSLAAGTYDGQVLVWRSDATVPR